MGVPYLQYMWMVTRGACESMWLPSVHVRMLVVVYYVFLLPVALVHACTQTYVHMQVKFHGQRSTFKTCVNMCPAFYLPCEYSEVGTNAVVGIASLPVEQH